MSFPSFRIAVDLTGVDPTTPLGMAIADQSLSSDDVGYWLREVLNRTIEATEFPLAEKWVKTVFAEIAQVRIERYGLPLAVVKGEVQEALKRISYSASFRSRSSKPAEFIQQYEDPMWEGLTRSGLLRIDQDQVVFTMPEMLAYLAADNLYNRREVTLTALLKPLFPKLQDNFWWLVAALMVIRVTDIPKPDYLTALQWFAWQQIDSNRLTPIQGEYELRRSRVDALQQSPPPDIDVDALNLYYACQRLLEFAADQAWLTPEFRAQIWDRVWTLT